MTRYLDQVEYLWLAEQVTGIDAEVLARSSRLALAESALMRPRHRSEARTSTPTSSTRRPSLLASSRNHPLPDGNKRAAWAALVMFVDLNGGRWNPDPPRVDDAERTMLAVAAGEIEERALSDWLRGRISFP